MAEEVIVGSAGVKLVPSATGFRQKADALLQDLSVAVDLDLDTTAAETQLTALSRDRNVELEVDVDAAGATTELAGISKAAGSASDGLGGLAVAAGALAPALLPAVAGAASLVATLAAPLAVSAGGLTLFGFLTAAAVKDIPQVAADMNAAEKSFLNAKETLQGTFDTLIDANSANLLGPLTEGMEILKQLLPATTPLIEAVSGALDNLLGKIDDEDIARVEAFIEDIAAMAGPAIEDTATALGNLGLGVGQILGALAGNDAGLPDGFMEWTESFANIGESQGFKDFVAIATENGPILTDFLNGLGGALGNIAVVMAPWGEIVLVGLTDFFNMIANADPDQLALVAGGLGAIGVALAIAGGPVTLGIVGFTALAGALAYAYENSEGFRTAVNDLVETIQPAWEWIKDEGATLWTETIAPSMKEIGAYIEDEFIPAWQDLWDEIGPGVEVLVKAFGSDTADKVRRGFEGIFNIVEGGLQLITGVTKAATGLLTGDWRKALDGLASISRGQFNILEGIFKLGSNLLPKPVRGAIDDMVSAAKALPGKVGDAVGDLWGKGKAWGRDLLDGFAAGLKSFVPSLPTPSLPSLPSWLGGDTNADGVLNYHGGLSWVGERGPELVYLPSGANVYTHTQSERMIAGALEGGGSSSSSALPDMVNINISVEELAQLRTLEDFFNMLRVRSRQGLVGVSV